jgi:serine/threonine-protein kinase
VPDLVSGYNIIRKLGEGARSQVYQVVEPSTGKTYTLKRVVRESHEDRRYLDQAIIGYEVAGRLNHPYLQKALALKKIRRFFRLVEVHVLLEYVDGLSLDKRPPERIDETVDLFLRVAEGLDAMHQVNYLHTDIKPNNLLIPVTGGVKIIDFGQSCPIGFRKARIQGTPDYIAPEQVQRRHLSRQTDVFNLGATLYWALTGQTYPTIITKRGRRRDPAAPLKKPVPAPQDLNPEIPSALSRLVMESCADDPGRRPRDMKEVISRLEMVHHVLVKRKLAGHDMAATARSPAGSKNGPTASRRPDGSRPAGERPSSAAPKIGDAP